MEFVATIVPNVLHVAFFAIYLPRQIDLSGKQGQRAFGNVVASQTAAETNNSGHGAKQIILSREIGPPRKRNRTKYLLCY